MSEDIKLSDDVLAMVCCPICRSNLVRSGGEFICTNVSCSRSFPIIDGVPVLINESNSLASIKSYLNAEEIYFRQGTIKDWVASRLPKIGRNLKARGNYKILASLLLDSMSPPKTLVLGGAVLGQGMEELLASGIQLIESDIALTERTQVVLDAHDIPFQDETFDGVIAQAVLEHVVDPIRCVKEISRVLKKGGLVYAEVPFMQQVHGGGIDFTRFTHLGLRRLFRRFEEISSGACCGPGMALAWSIQYFLLSFIGNTILRIAVKVLSALLLFPLKYFDYFLIDKPGALDAASAYFFMGRRSSQTIKDAELLKGYQGAL